MGYPIAKLKIPQHTFNYRYLAGPVETERELGEGVKDGNCRFAIQQYFHELHGLFLQKDEIYLPGGYKHLGSFIFEEEEIDWEQLQPGDIIFAENKRNKKNEQIDRSQKSFDTKDEWLLYLHSAIYVGKENNNHYIWHSTSICGGTCTWDLSTFCHNYKPVSAKRVYL